MPRFLDTANYRHDSTSRTGILLANLGTPDAAEPSALRRYLAEFLWDGRVVEVPRPVWWLILHGIILRTRPARSAEAYASVWTDEGSPLLVNGRAQAEGIAARLAEAQMDVPVALGMRYGNPSIPDALHELREKNVRRLLVLPLYPQYCAATTASTFDAVTRELHNWRWIPELRFINQYHDDDAYIDALAASVREHRARNGGGEKLLISFHGIPHRNLLEGDPYHCQCQKTARLLAERLHLPDDAWTVSFQSRLGKAKWLQPYTLETVQKMATDGVKNLDVICPGFSADCVETLEEIVMENGDAFCEAGGERLNYIEALNARDDHLDALTALLRRHLGGWEDGTEGGLEHTRDRALALGANR